MATTPRATGSRHRKPRPKHASSDKFPLKRKRDETIYTKDEISDEIYDVTSPRSMTEDILGFDFISVLRKEKNSDKSGIDIRKTIRDELLSKAALRESAKREAGNVKRENFSGYSNVTGHEINTASF